MSIPLDGPSNDAGVALPADHKLEIDYPGKGLLEALTFVAYVVGLTLLAIAPAAVISAWRWFL